jgi:hypothetical protein
MHRVLTVVLTIRRSIRLCADPVVSRNPGTAGGLPSARYRGSIQPAVRQRVSSGTQNQTLCAILFLRLEVLAQRANRVSETDDGMIRVVRSARVAVPADVAWSYVTDTSKLDSWWDARLVSAELAGPMGRSANTSRFANGPWVTLDVVEVDAPTRTVRLSVRLPLGMTNDVTVAILPLEPNRCTIGFRWQYALRVARCLLTKWDLLAAQRFVTQDVTRNLVV